MINQRLEGNILLDRLFKFQGKGNYSLYKLLSQYDTEILLYIMAKANNRTIKRLVSHYFTKLKGTESLVKGKDLRAMGFSPGPLYREILEALLEARLNKGVTSREDEEAFVKEHYGLRSKTGHL
jgi:tRNA nucleotidyltransferase (CCA-adding enzyme)